MIVRLAAGILILALSGSASTSTADAPAPPSLSAIAGALVGTWQSTDDTRFTREFDPGGHAIDRYDGDASATTEGHWLVFVGSSPPKGLAGQTLDPKAYYLELDQNGDQLVFGLVTLSRAELKMIYLTRGNLLAFVRLK